MPQVHSPNTSPSLNGSTSVEEVFKRIQIRDPGNLPSGIYGRRMTDFQSNWLSAETFMFIVLSALVVAFAYWMSMQHLAGSWTQPAPVLSTPAPAKPTPANEIQQTVPQVNARRMASPAKRPPELAPGPEKLHARFIGPRMIELQWDSMGTGYRYRIYAADNAGFVNAKAITPNSIGTSLFAWQPDDEVRNVWLAVKAFNEKGEATALGSTLLVQLPE